jgi:uncharacterized phosphatase
MDKNLTTIYIVRHGETEWNAAGRIQGGMADSPLTETGKKQAAEIREKFKSVHFDALFSSDLLRAKHTAEIIALERQLVVNTTNLIRERMYGKFEGRLAHEYQQENKEIFEKIRVLEWKERRKMKVLEDLETEEGLCNRMIIFMREIAATYTGKTVLVVSHGGIMRVFLSHILGKELEPGAIRNTGYIKIESDGTDFFVKETEGIKLD